MPIPARVVLGLCIAAVGAYLLFKYELIYIRIAIYVVTVFTIVVIDSLIETLLENRKL